MIKKIYCEIMTKEDVMMLERTMLAMGIDEISRPLRWANRPPAWFTEGRKRNENEDPLAVVEVAVEGDRIMVDSSYRFAETNYTKVSPDDMNTILQAMSLWQNVPV